MTLSFELCATAHTHIIFQKNGHLRRHGPGLLAGGLPSAPTSRRRLSESGFARVATCPYFAR